MNCASFGNVVINKCALSPLDLQVLSLCRWLSFATLLTFQFSAMLILPPSWYIWLKQRNDRQNTYAGISWAEFSFTIVCKQINIVRFRVTTASSFPDSCTWVRFHQDNCWYPCMCVQWAASHLSLRRIYKWTACNGGKNHELFDKWVSNNIARTVDSLY